MERQSISGSAWGAAFVALLINSAYLAATASPTLFYFANVVLHMGLGVVLGIVWVRRVLRGRTAADRSERLAAAPGPFALAAIVLALGGVAGLAIMVVGAAGRTRWLLPAHIGLMVAGGAPLLARAAWIAMRRAQRSRRRALAGTYAVVLLAFAASLGMAMTRDGRMKAAYRITNPAVVPASMQQEGRGPHSPFFPSSADTNVRGIIPANFFMTSQSCGR